MSSRTVLFTIVAILLFPSNKPAHADSVQIINKVSTESSTGNSAEGSTGLTRTEVRVQTTINGEIVEDFEKSEVGEGGSDASIEYENTIRLDEDIKLQTSRNLDDLANVGGEEEIESSSGNSRLNDEISASSSNSEDLGDEQSETGLKNFINKIIHYVQSLWPF